MKVLGGKWPFVVSALVLALTVLLGLYFFDATPGFAEPFSTLSGYAGSAVKAQQMPGPPELDWLTGILLGLLLGGLAGSLIDNSWKTLLSFEEENNPGMKIVRTAFFGMLSGFLFMLGALIAGESFFGQFASAMELSPGAWLFLIAMTIAGGITALLKAHGGGGAGSSGGGDGGKPDKKAAK